MAEAQGVVASILASYEQLSESERRIADFVLAHAGSVSLLTAGEIAQGSETSNTTVSRFVRTLGYESFAQLRLALAREEAAAAASDDAPRGISFDDVEGSVRYLLERKVEELGSTASTLDAGELKEAARLVQHSGTVLVAGVGSSLACAQMAALKLSHVGVRAVSPSTTDAATLLAQLMGPGDCVVFVSNSGASRRLNQLMDAATDAAVPTVLVTTSAQGPLAARADHVLLAANHDHLLARDFAVSHNGINFVLECLTLLLYSDSPDAQEYLRIFQKSFKDEKGV